MKISVQRYRAIDNLRKSTRKRIVSSKSFIPVLCILSVIALACLHVWQRVYVIHLVENVTVVENENKKLKDILKKSRIEEIELQRLSRIEKIATEKLGLSRTGAENMFTLTSHGIERERDGLDGVVTSLKKIADNLPAMNEGRAQTLEIFEQDD